MYTLHIFTNTDEQLNRPIIRKVLGEFDVLNHEVVESTEDGTSHYQLIQTLATYAIGSTHIPTKTVSIRYRGQPKEIQLPAIPIAVVSVRTSTQDVENCWH